MAASSKNAGSSPPATGTQDVDAFLRALDHPLEAGLETLRATILGVDPAIREGIKWNAPSFHFREYFATLNVRKGELLVILHRGAKVKDNSTAAAIDDPSGLLQWLATDRAAVRFIDLEAVRAGRAAFARIVRQWIASMP